MQKKGTKIVCKREKYTNEAFKMHPDQIKKNNVPKPFYLLLNCKFNSWKYPTKWINLQMCKQAQKTAWFFNT